MYSTAQDEFQMSKIAFLALAVTSGTKLRTNDKELMVH